MKTGSIGLLTGDNGSGKTTFLNFLKINPHFIKPDTKSDDIILLDQLYEHLLFPYKSLWWNISLPEIVNNSCNHNEARRKAEIYLSQFSIELDLERYPGDLSGGEKHIILLARFSLVKQSTLFLDEPFSAIDSNRRLKAWSMIKTLVRNYKKNIIIATHDACENAEIINEIEFSGIGGKKMFLKQLSFMMEENHERV